MNRQSRSRRVVPKLLVAALAGLWIGAPGLALADHDRHRDRDYNRHGSAHHGVPVYRHGDACARASRASHHGYRRHQASYTCGPCSHRFDSRRDFHRHLAHHHHVPPWALPFVIAKVALGWVFYG